MSAQTEVPFPDLSDPETFAPDVPHEAFRRMQSLPGLYWQETPVGNINGGFWAVTRWDDIVAVESDPTLFTSTRGGAYPTTWSPYMDQQANNIMANDPPNHSRLRRAAARGFGPRVVANFEPWIKDIVTPIVDRIETLEQFDYVQEVAQTIPASVVARVMGVVPEDEPMMVDWALRTFAALQPKADNTALADMMVVFGEIAQYAAKIQEYKRQNPADDMFTELGACVERGEISQAEFIDWMSLMMTAGFETTHTAIGQSMRLYVEDAQVRERTDRAIREGLTDRVIDEFLRLVSPPMEMARVATQDTVVGGQQVRKDDVLVTYFIAANRDPSKFSNPDEFDPWRPETDTLAFGSGVHRCIGAFLAKLELRILWEEIVRRDLKLELAGEPQRGWSVFINQLHALPLKRAA